MEYDLLLQDAKEIAPRAGDEILLTGFTSDKKDLSFKD
jgi:hypothetical protein